MPNKEPGAIKVIKQYKEEGRHGETYTAQRLPVGERRDFLPRIKRKEQKDPKGF